jgi:membrane protease YdiL (CAAX protease family)
VRTRETRLAAWLSLVGVQILLGYASRAASGKPDRNVVYEWSTFVQSAVYYGVFLAIVLFIARGDERNLLALRRPRSWATAIGIATAVIVSVFVIELLLDPLLHPDREQGLTPTHWEPAHAAAFAASFVALVVIGPFVEEATFRGLGYSLLAPFGSVLAIVSTGVLFGLAHGLVEALPVLVALGIGLAYLRARTDSIYPGVAVHALFNAIALILAVTT